MFCPCSPALSYGLKCMTIFCPIVFHCRLMQLLRALCNVSCVLRTRRSGTELAPATFGTPRETSLSYLCPANAVFSAAEHSDAAGTHLARPRTATCAEGGRTTRSVLSKKDRTAVAFFWFHKLLLPRRGQKGLQCPIREMIGQLLFPPGRWSFPVGAI